MVIEPQKELDQLRLALLQTEGQMKDAESKLGALRDQHTRIEGTILYIIGKVEAQTKAQAQPAVETQP